MSAVVIAIGYQSSVPGSHALEEFKLSLAQTFVWCRAHVISGDPASLRTPELRPRLLEESRSSAVSTVIRERERFGGPNILTATIPNDLGGGRLLVYFPNRDLACGRAELESERFFDVNNVPPWDTWVSYFLDQKSIDYYATEYLIAWLPPEFLKLVNRGIEINPEQCIQWLSETPLELAKSLRAENFLGY